MSVRDPRFEPRRPESSARRGPAPVRRSPSAWLAVVGAPLLLVAAIAAGGGLLPGSSPASPGAAVVAGSPTGTSPSAALPTPAPTASAETASPPGTLPPPGTAPPTVVPSNVAIVPVTNFRSPLASTNRADLAALSNGGKGRFGGLVLVGSDADAILGALGLDRATLGDRLTTQPTAEALAVDLAAHRDRLGFLRADEVGPSVRALAWGRTSLFGVQRVETLADWPLAAPLPASTAGGTTAGPAVVAYDPAAAWTLVAGGDILLDRGVSLSIRNQRRGADFPFDGGTAEITGHTCCSQFGWKVPTTRRTGNAGVVRGLLESADLAIANFENPAPDRPRWHSSGVVFNADPDHIEGLVNAGIDWVSLANNHIGDAGRTGILQTIANLDRWGIRHSGAGKDIAAARKPALIDVGDVTVALLGYDSIARYYHADADTPGSMPFTGGFVRTDVARAREAGADIVIVFPHWGTEYDATPFAGQQRLAHAAIDAGADMVIGNHAHWAAAVEVYEGKPIWYALGNFVFDQTWSEPTMEGITLELTFQGATLVQARMRPHVILDKAQPNFMDPAGDGKVVMSQVFRASKGLLDW